MLPNHKGNHGHANANWQSGGETWERVSVTVLQDIRHELQILNNLLHCNNFAEFPRVLRQIRANTSKPRRKNKKGTHHA